MRCQWIAIIAFICMLARPIQGNTKLLIELTGVNSSTSEVADFARRAVAFANDTNITIAVDDVNECESLTLNTCSEFADCSNTDGSFTCGCLPGFTDISQGSPGRNCSDIDECLGIHNCSENGFCKNGVGNFSCVCNQGFTGDGTTCRDVDECSEGTSNCAENATCANTLGSYNCTCHVGFTGDGFTCTEILAMTTETSTATSATTSSTSTTISSTVTSTALTTVPSRITTTVSTTASTLNETTVHTNSISLSMNTTSQVPTTPLKPATEKESTFLVATTSETTIPTRSSTEKTSLTDPADTMASNWDDTTTSLKFEQDTTSSPDSTSPTSTRSKPSETTSRTVDTTSEVNISFAAISLDSVQETTTPASTTLATSVQSTLTTATDHSAAVSRTQEASNSPAAKFAETTISSSLRTTSPAETLAATNTDKDTTTAPSVSQTTLRDSLTSSQETAVRNEQNESTLKTTSEPTDTTLGQTNETTSVIRSESTAVASRPNVNPSTGFVSTVSLTSETTGQSVSQPEPTTLGSTTTELNRNISVNGTSLHNESASADATQTATESIRQSRTDESATQYRISQTTSVETATKSNASNSTTLKDTKAENTTNSSQLVSESTTIVSDIPSIHFTAESRSVSTAELNFSSLTPKNMEIVTPQVTESIGNLTASTAATLNGDSTTAVPSDLEITRASAITSSMEATTPAEPYSASSNSHPSITEATTQQSATTTLSQSPSNTTTLAGDATTQLASTAISADGAVVTNSTQGEPATSTTLQETSEIAMTPNGNTSSFTPGRTVGQTDVETNAAQSRDTTTINIVPTRVPVTVGTTEPPYQDVPDTDDPELLVKLLEEQIKDSPGELRFNLTQANSTIETFEKWFADNVTIALDQDVANTMFDTIDGFANGASGDGDGQIDPAVAARITAFVTKLLETMDLPPGGFNETKNTLILEAKDVVVTDISTEFNFLPGYGSRDRSISLPSGFIQSGTPRENEEEPKDTDSVRLAFTEYSDSRLFLDLQTEIVRADVLYTKDDFTNAAQIVNSPVIGASIGGKNVLNSSEQVTVKLRTIARPLQSSNDNGTIEIVSFTTHKCVWWDYDNLTWSEEGCELNASDDDSITCKCNHLTSFAVIMSVEKTMEDPILLYLSYAGAGLSIFGLLWTILTYSIFRSLRKHRSKKLLLHFCTALCGVYITYLLGLAAKLPSNQAQCIASGFFLHFLTLSVMAWMTVEVFDMYIMFVKVMWSSFHKYMLKATLFAWLTPFLIAIITLGAHLGVPNQGIYPIYSKETVCWLGQIGMLYAFILPSCILLFVNLILFAIVLYHVTFKRNHSAINRLGKKSTKKVKAGQHIVNALALLLLAGPTWIIGYFINIRPVEDDVFRRTLSYVFVLLNAFQGFWIFVVFSVRPLPVQRRWRNLITKGRFGEITTITSSSGSRHTRTTRGTAKSPRTSVAPPPRDPSSRSENSSISCGVKEPVRSTLSSISSSSDSSNSRSSSKRSTVPLTKYIDEPAVAILGSPTRRERQAIGGSNATREPSIKEESVNDMASKRTQENPYDFAEPSSSIEDVRIVDNSLTDGEDDAI